VLLLVMLEILLNIFVSSANFNIQLTIPRSKSLMKIRKSTGPRTDPCGTPLHTGFQVDCSPLMHTLSCLWLSSYLSSLQLYHQYHDPSALTVNVGAVLCRRPSRNRGILHRYHPRSPHIVLLCPKTLVIT